MIKVIDYGALALPKKAYKNDIGFDIFFNCENCTLEPHETKVYPLGFGLDLRDTNFWGQLIQRSSVAKNGIIVNSSPIDTGYLGEIKMIATNCSNKPFQFVKGERYCQLVFHTVTNVNIDNLGNANLLDYNEIINYTDNERNNKGVGSTNAKDN